MEPCSLVCNGSLHVVHKLSCPQRSTPCLPQRPSPPAPASPHSLRHSRRRTLARSPSLDPPTLSFLLTRQGPQPRLSWQVLGWSETSPPSPPTLLRWSRRRSGRPATVCKTHAPPASPRLGRL